jgi:3-deoxy-7-phosphoheptulonate synthase
LIDVHVAPDQALCDGAQALRPQQFADVMSRLAPVVAALGRRMSGGPTDRSSGAR